jgi:hypothetical protein
VNLILRGEPGFEDACCDRIFNRRLAGRTPAAVLRAPRPADAGRRLAEMIEFEFDQERPN